jgi:hypothetical protein
MLPMQRCSWPPMSRRGSLEATWSSMVEFHVKLASKRCRNSISQHQLLDQALRSHCFLHLRSRSHTIVVLIEARPLTAVEARARRPSERSE